MSDDLDITVTVSQDFLGNCLIVSAQALCCYDFFLTFVSEARFMWTVKPSIGSVLFFSLRYPMLCNIIAVVLNYLFSGNWQDSKSCTVIMRLQIVGDILILTSSAIFTATRIYAVSGRSKWRGWLILLLGVINPIMAMYTLILYKPYLARIAPHYQTCDINMSSPKDIWMMCARASAVIFDAVALLFTWLSIRHLVNVGRQADISEVDSSPMDLENMSIVLMKDTAIYFGFLSVINASGIACPKFINAASTWSAVMSSILLGRLMLDLHQAKTQHIDSGTSISCTMIFDNRSNDPNSSAQLSDYSYLEESGVDCT